MVQMGKGCVAPVKSWRGDMGSVGSLPESPLTGQPQWLAEVTHYWKACRRTVQGEIGCLWVRS